MTEATREYELVLMLDPGLEESARDALAQEARGQIDAAGDLRHENAWGLRKLAYEIDQRTEADYRWFRFQAPPDLLTRLDHNLKIADGVLRFRVFRVDPDSPVLDAPPPAGAPAPSRERGSRGEQPARGQQAPPAAEQAPPAAEQAPPAAEQAPPAAEQAPPAAEQAPPAAEQAPPAAEPSGDSEESPPEAP
ncbi:MAG: 30S ribosomal protein S6 [Solirubrobacterales bacterium]